MAVCPLRRPLVAGDNQNENEARNAHMKALVVAPQPFFSPRGTPFSVYYRTLVMAELGIEIDLLTYGQGQDVDLPGVRIVRIPNVPGLGEIKTGPSMPKVLLDALMFIWTVGMLIRRRYDFVHAHEEAVFFCRFLKPLFGFRLVYDMHSSLPQQLDNFEFSKSKTLKALFSKLESSSLKAADAVITICPDLSDYVIGEIGDSPKHVLIENSIFEPVRLAGMSGQRNEQPTALDVEIPADRPLVVYAGTFERYQGLDILIPAFAEAKRSCPDAVLLMAGGTPQQVSEMKELVRRCGLDEDVIIIGRVPQMEAKRINNAATVLTSPRSSGTNTPLKLYEQLSLGKPLVATRIYSHTQVLSEDVAFLVEPSAEDMARGITAALTNPDLAAAKGRAARAMYESKYSRPVYERKMKVLLDRIKGVEEVGLAQ